MSAVARVGVELDARSALAGMRQLESRAEATTKKFDGLERVATRLASAFAGIKAAEFVFVKTAELERQTRSLEVLTGSLENANSIIKELQDFGAVTPFTSAELIETANRLKAFGFETEQLVDVTKRLGDVAGATGADLGGIATAFGQIQAKGRLQGEELLQLQERGIGLQDELQKMYGLTADEFRKALEKGRISADAVNLALQNITSTGGKYADGAIAQSDTLNGKLSTLTDSVEVLARSFGTILAPAIKSTFDIAIQALGAVNDLIEVQLLSGQLGVSIPPETQRALEETATQIAELRTGETGLIKSMGFSEEYNKVLRQLEKSELERQGFEMGLLKVPDALEQAATQAEVPALLQGTSGTGGKAVKSEAEKEAEKEAKRLQDIAAASADRVASLEEQTLLASALNEEERIQLERQLQIADIMDETNGLSDEQRKAELAATTALFEQQDVTANLLKQQQDRKTAAEELAEAEAKAAQELNAVYQQIGDTISSGVVDALKGAVDGTTSLADAATNMLDGLIDQMLTLATNMLIFGNIGGTFSSGSGLLGGLFGGGFFADGGRPPVGQPSIVGERGPELFVPDTSGTIIPNGEFGMGGSTNIVVNVDAKGSSAEGAGKGKELGTAIGAAVQAELIKQKRPGGLLS